MDYSILRQQILNDIKNDPIAKGNSKALGYMIQNNAATYQTAADYSKILGDVVSKNINNNIPDGIPDNELAEFADECLVPIYKQSQDTMLNACKNIQQIYNNQAEIGLKPVDVKRDDSRTQNISKRFSEAEKYDDVSFLTNENVSRSITRGAVQDSIRENSKMQSDAGLKIRLSRSDGSGCCQWCSGLVGDYDSFEKLPADFWKIHRNCNCVIDYNVGKKNERIKFTNGKDSDLEKVTEEIIGYGNNGNNDNSSGGLTYFEGKDIKEAEKYAKNVLGLNVDYSQFNLELANAINAEMTNMVNTFGDVIGAGYIKSVEYYPGISDWYAAYNPDLKALLFKNVSYADILSRMKADANDEYSIGFWSTSDTMHIARHEAGHAIGNWLVGNDPIKAGKLRKIRENVSDKCGIIEWKIDPAVEESIKAGEYISYYALKNNNELIAESIAEYMTGNPRETAREVISILMEG